MQRAFSLQRNQNINTRAHCIVLDRESLIKKTIGDVSKEYKGHHEVDKILLWDVIKMEIRAATIKYAKAKKACSR